MSTAPANRKTSAGRDLLWIVFGVAVLAYGIVSIVVALKDRSYGRFGLSLIFGFAISALPIYWLAAGAWRRTRWGQRRLEIEGASPSDHTDVER